MPESRAIDSALASQPFQTPTMQMARGLSDGVIGRWAPEQNAVEGSRALRSLAFADRIISPYVGLAESSASSGLTHHSQAPAIRPLRVTPISSWLFPIPWYQDELEWLAAARTTAPTRQSGSATPTRPGSPASLPPPTSRPSFSVALEYVAPSMAMGRPVQAEPLRAAPTVAVLQRHLARSAPPPRQPSPQAIAQMAMPLRAWSPLVSFPAAQAAEVMAGVIAAAHGFDDDPARTVPAASMMEYVAPSQLAQRPVGAPRPQPLAAAIRARLSESLRRPPVDRPLVPAAPEMSPVVVQPGRAIPPADVDSTVAPLAEVLPSTVAPPAIPIAVPPTSVPSPTTASTPVRVMRDVAARSATATTTPAPTTAPTTTAPRAATPTAGGFELLARAALAEAPGLAPASGPRVALPVGLGGLMTGLRAAQVVSRPLLAPSPRPLFIPVAAASPVAPVAPVARPAAASGKPAPTLDLVAPLPELSYGESSLASIQRHRPAALGHVAWADRWLARFAGASVESLAAMGQQSTGSVSRQHPHSLGVAAPSSVFVTAPAWSRATESAAATTPSSVAVSSAGPSSGAGLTGAAAPSPATSAVTTPGFVPDDSEPVPDEVFSQIAAAAISERVSRKPALAAAAAADRARQPVVRPPAAPMTFPNALPSLADRLLRVPPTMPGAGLRAGLAASPVAPALANVAPLPPSPSFDIRSVTSSAVAGAYLAGAIEPITVGFRLAATRPSLVLGSHRAMATMPGLAPADPRFLELAVRAPTPELLSAIARGEIDAGSVTRVAIGSPPSTASGSTVPTAPAPASAPVADRGPTVAREAISDRPLEPGFEAATPIASTATMAATATLEEFADQAAPPSAPLFTTIAAPFLPAGIELTPASRHEPIAPWSPRPGHTAQMAHDWSVDQHRTAADLSFDFVPPELIIAARTYGFGPIEAARAARLAAGGESGLMMMASAIDMTFLEALSAHSHEAATASYLASSPETPVQRAAATAPSAGMGSTTARAATGVATATATAAAPHPATLAAAVPTYEPIQLAAPRRADPRYGGGRTPRGAFLWPQSSADALELRAAGADASYPYSLAALDLIAANVVAEAGAYPIHFEEVVSSATAPRSPASTIAAPVASLAAAAPVVPPITSTPPSPPAEGAATAMDPAILEDDQEEGSRILPPVLLSATGGQAPAVVREQFQAIYLALSRSPAGRSLSPTVRAARALALAQQVSQGTRSSARARAAAAWAVMPMVMSTADTSLDPVYLSAGETTVTSGDPTTTTTDSSRRGDLQLVAARAGRSLQSLVAPSEQPSQETSTPTGYQTPSAATPMVQTGPSEATLQRALIAAQRDTSLEIPHWFAAAAKKVFSESRGEGEGISVAEMTMVQTTPVHHLAAKPAGGSSTAAAATVPATGGGDGSQPSPDVEKLAREIYAEICMMIDIARERSGDPWQS